VASPNVQSQLFRKVALDRLSSPEQLDSVVKVVTLKSWIALTPFIALLSLATLWGFLGSIPTKVTGKCMLIQAGGLRDVTAGSPGRITEMKVKVGDTIVAGQAIARVAQPDLAERISTALGRLAELKRQESELEGQIGNAQRLSKSLLSQQSASVERQLKAAQDRNKVMAEWYQAQQTLFRQGLLTRQGLLNAERELAASQQEVESAQSQLQEAGLRGAENDKRALQEITAIRNQISETRSSIDLMRSSLAHASEVVSSYAGRVIELKARPGTLVSQGDALVTVESSDGGRNELEAVIYIAAGEGKKVEDGMEAQIVPSTVKREEHGFMVAKVLSVSEYAATAESMLSVLQNRQIVQELSAGSSPIEVRARLQEGATPSGFKWSSEMGPPFKVRTGTLGTAEIVVYRQAPITLVIPFLRKSFGFD
jgi:HlyD family secretion protein